MLGWWDGDGPFLVGSRDHRFSSGKPEGLEFSFFGGIVALDIPIRVSFLFSRKFCVSVFVFVKSD